MTNGEAPLENGDDEAWEEIVTLAFSEHLDRMKAHAQAYNDPEQVAKREADEAWWSAYAERARHDDDDVRRQLNEACWQADRHIHEQST